MIRNKKNQRKSNESCFEASLSPRSRIIAVAEDAHCRGYVTIVHRLLSKPGIDLNALMSSGGASSDLHKALGMCVGFTYNVDLSYIGLNPNIFPSSNMPENEIDRGEKNISDNFYALLSKFLEEVPGLPGLFILQNWRAPTRKDSDVSADESESQDLGDEDHPNNIPATTKVFPIDPVFIRIRVAKVSMGGLVYRGSARKFADSDELKAVDISSKSKFESAVATVRETRQSPPNLPSSGKVLLQIICLSVPPFSYSHLQSRDETSQGKSNQRSHAGTNVFKRSRARHEHSETLKHFNEHGHLMFSHLPLSLQKDLARLTRAFKRLVSAHVVVNLRKNVNVTYRTLKTLRAHLTRLRRSEVQRLVFNLPLIRNPLEGDEDFDADSTETAVGKLTREEIMEIFSTQFSTNPYVPVKFVISPNGERIFFLSALPDHGESVGDTASFTPNNLIKIPWDDSNTRKHLRENASVHRRDTTTHIPFWLVMVLNENDQLDAKCCGLGASKTTIEKVMFILKIAIDQTCHRVNQLSLLQYLHATRFAPPLLLPPLASHILGGKRYSFGPKKESLQGDKELEGRYSLDSDTKSSGTGVAFKLGEFQCDMKYVIRIGLHPRLQGKPSARRLGQRIFRNFAVIGRKNLFVFKEQSGEIFYMRFRDRNENVVRAESEQGVVSKQKETVHDVKGLQFPGFEEDSDRKKSAFKALKDNELVLEIYGVEEPSNDIIEKLTGYLENMAKTLVRNEISRTLIRNPSLKLDVDDLNFLRPPNTFPEHSSFTLLPPRVEYDPYLALGYIAQNLSTTLIPVRFLRSSKMDSQCDENEIASCVEDDLMFVFNTDLNTRRTRQKQNAARWRRDVPASELSNQGLATVFLSIMTATDLDDGRKKLYPVEFSTSVVSTEHRGHDRGRNLKKVFGELFSGREAFNSTMPESETLHSGSYIRANAAGKLTADTSLGLLLEIYVQGTVEIDSLVNKVQQAVQEGFYNFYCELLLQIPISPCDLPPRFGLFATISKMALRCAHSNFSHLETTNSVFGGIKLQSARIRIPRYSLIWVSNHLGRVMEKIGTRAADSLVKSCGASISKSKDGSKVNDLSLTDVADFIVPGRQISPVGSPFASIAALAMIGGFNHEDNSSTTTIMNSIPGESKDSVTVQRNSPKTWRNIMRTPPSVVHLKIPKGSSQENSHGKQELNPFLSKGSVRAPRAELGFIERRLGHAVLLSDTRCEVVFYNLRSAVTAKILQTFQRILSFVQNRNSLATGIILQKMGFAPVRSRLISEPEFTLPPELFITPKVFAPASTRNSGDSTKLNLTSVPHLSMENLESVVLHGTMSSRNRGTIAPTLQLSASSKDGREAKFATTGVFDSVASPGDNSIPTKGFNASGSGHADKRKLAQKGGLSQQGAFRRYMHRRLGSHRRGVRVSQPRERHSSSQSSTQAASEVSMGPKSVRVSAAALINRNRGRSPSPAEPRRERLSDWSMPTSREQPMLRVRCSSLYVTSREPSNFCFPSGWKKRSFLQAFLGIHPHVVPGSTHIASQIVADSMRSERKGFKPGNSGLDPEENHLQQGIILASMAGIYMQQLGRFKTIRNYIRARHGGQDILGGEYPGVEDGKKGQEIEENAILSCMKRVVVPVAQRHLGLGFGALRESFSSPLMDSSLTDLRKRLRTKILMRCRAFHFVRIEDVRNDDREFVLFETYKGVMILELSFQSKFVGITVHQGFDERSVCSELPSTFTGRQVAVGMLHSLQLDAAQYDTHIEWLFSVLKNTTNFDRNSAPLWWIDPRKFLIGALERYPEPPNGARNCILSTSLEVSSGWEDLNSRELFSKLSTFSEIYNVRSLAHLGENLGVYVDHSALHPQDLPGSPHSWLSFVFLDTREYDGQSAGVEIETDEKRATIGAERTIKLLIVLLKVARRPLKSNEASKDSEDSGHFIRNEVAEQRMMELGTQTLAEAVQRALVHHVRDTTWMRIVKGSFPNSNSRFLFVPGHCIAAFENLIYRRTMSSLDPSLRCLELLAKDRSNCRFLLRSLRAAYGSRLREFKHENTHHVVILEPSVPDTLIHIKMVQANQAEIFKNNMHTSSRSMNFFNRSEYHGFVRSQLYICHRKMPPRAHVGDPETVQLRSAYRKAEKLIVGKFVNISSRVMFFRSEWY